MLPILFAGLPAMGHTGGTLFGRTWVPGEGLGPRYNEASCAACHTLGGPGGAGPRDKDVLLRLWSDGTRVVPRVPGLQLEVRAWSPDLVTRNAPALFGAGQIDTIPDEVLLAQAEQGAGRVGRDAAGAVARFGWKADVARLADAVRSEGLVHLGLEPEDLGPTQLEALTDYVSTLPAPERLSGADAGEALFTQLGCVACHPPQLGDVSGLYSDLLLHDLGEGLQDMSQKHPVVAVPGVSAAEWRTPPLWGVRDSAPYLHDGRARSLAEAITLHGGEAAAATDGFSALTEDEQGDVVAFLNSLVAP